MSSPLVSLGIRLATAALLAGAANAQFLDVAAGRDFSLALRDDGKVVVWSGIDNSEAVSTVPGLPPGVEYVEIAAGGIRLDILEFSYPMAIARRSDGVVVAWGDNSSGQHDVPPLPPGLTYVEIAAGPRHGLARRSDGEVVAWGNNNYAQNDVPALPPGLTYTGISAGGMDNDTDYGFFTPPYYTSSHRSHSVALRSDGSVVAWGNNHFGQCNVLALPPGLTYVEVSAGSNHTLALRSDGSVVAWGGNAYGQCNVPAPPPGLSYVDIEAGGGQSAARLSDGSMVAWGNNAYGQLAIPALPAGLTWLDISVGGSASSSEDLSQCFGCGGINTFAYSHTVALRSDGAVLTWGVDWCGQASICSVWSIEDHGQGLAGTSGFPPSLIASLGCPTGPEQPVALSLFTGLSGTTTTLVIGLSRVDLPLLGGTLVPAADVLLDGMPVSTSGSGYLMLSGDMPAVVPPGLELFFQHWAVDPGAPQGLSASNAISLTAP